MFTYIHLDKTRLLKYGMRAFALIEKTLKTKLNKLDFEDLSIHDQATIIWAGLIHEQPDLTVDRVMDLVDEHSTIGEAIRLSGQAFAEAWGVKTDEGKNQETASLI